MDKVVSKKVRFSDKPTIVYVVGDCESRRGLWVSDALRFKQACDCLPPIPIYITTVTDDERLMMRIIDEDETMLFYIKKNMNSVTFYWLMFSSILQSHLFKVLKNNLIKHKTIIVDVIGKDVNAIQGLNNAIVSKGYLRKFSPHIFQLLYLEGVLDEEDIMKWYNKRYENKKAAYLHRFGRCLLTPLIEWLSTAAEEEENV